MKEPTLRAMLPCPKSFQYALSIEAVKRKIDLKQPRTGDAGYDIQSLENVTLFLNEQKLVPTGLTIEIPWGYVGLLKDRSSLALRQLYVHAGVVDSSYRGEIQILIENRGETPYHIESGQRIAQLLFIPVRSNMMAKRVQHDELTKSARGTGNFGSTGK